MKSATMILALVSFAGVAHDESAPLNFEALSESRPLSFVPDNATVVATRDLVIRAREPFVDFVLNSRPVCGGYGLVPFSHFNRPGVAVRLDGMEPQGVDRHIRAGEQLTLGRVDVVSSRVPRSFHYSRSMSCDPRVESDRGFLTLMTTEGVRFVLSGFRLNVTSDLFVETLSLDDATTAEVAAATGIRIVAP